MFLDWNHQCMKNLLKKKKGGTLVALFEVYSSKKLGSAVEGRRNQLLFVFSNRG